MQDTLRITHLLRGAITDHTASAVAFGVSVGDGPLAVSCAGHHLPGAGQPTTKDSIFDLASLTKPLSTTLWCLRLAEAGRLDLDAPINTFVTLDDPQLGGCPVWRLLSHTSGFPAHRAYFAGLGPCALTGRFEPAKRSVRRMLRGTQAAYTPGQAEVYSDLGFMMLAWICEQIDQPLEAAWPTLPGHGADALHFRPHPSGPHAAYAATETCPWRGRTLQGEVHDDNCWTVGGVEGHAGLFGSITQVHALGHRVMRTFLGEDMGLGISSARLRFALAGRRIHSRGSRVLGWDTVSPVGSTAGQLFSRGSLGHLGFTGTSLWFDPSAEVVMVLLTNRVVFGRDGQGIQTLRPKIHDAGWELVRRHQAMG